MRIGGRRYIDAKPGLGDSSREKAVGNRWLLVGSRREGGPRSKPIRSPRQWPDVTVEIQPALQTLRKFTTIQSRLSSHNFKQSKKQYNGRAPCEGRRQINIKTVHDRSLGVGLPSAREDLPDARPRPHLPVVDEVIDFGELQEPAAVERRLILRVQGKTSGQGQRQQRLDSWPSTGAANMLRLLLRRYRRRCR